MSLLFMAGFDLSDDDLPGRWNTWHANNDIQSGSSPHGNHVRMDCNNNSCIQKSVPAAATYIVGGMWMMTGSGSTIANMSFAETSIQHVTIQVDGVNQRLTAFRGNLTTSLGSTPNNTFLNGVWHHVEIKVTISNTVGVVEIRIDGVVQLNLTNQDTQNAGTSVINTIWAGANSGAAANLHLDSFYIMDTAGSDNNDFLGPCRVTSVLPTSDGATEEWDRSTGSDSFALLDEADPNGDTDYIESDVDNERTLLGMANLPATADTVFGVQLSSYARKTDAGAAEFRQGLRSNSNDTGAADKVLAETYALYLDLFEKNPDGTVDWTPSTVDAAEVFLDVRT